MKSIQKFSGLKSVLIGVLVYVICSLIFMIIETTLLYNGITDEKNMSFISNVIHLISAAVGCLVGKSTVNEKKMMTAIYIGVGDILLVLIIKLLFSSLPVSAIWIRLLMIAIGTAIGCILFAGKRKKSNFRNRKIRIR